MLIHHPYLTQDPALEAGRRYARLQAACDGEAGLCVIDASDEVIVRERIQTTVRRRPQAVDLSARAAA